MISKFSPLPGFRFIVALFLLLTFVCPGADNQLKAAPAENVPADARCPVCGMFVAKYDVWITQIRTADDTVHNFDGVKDMMAFYFNPGSFGMGKQQEMTELWVKDYYSLKWTDARESFYVTGSDVHGPMGHELVPFASRDAAESFLSDHKGKKVHAFREISAELVDSLRSGHKMKK